MFSSKVILCVLFGGFQALFQQLVPLLELDSFRLHVANERGVVAFRGHQVAAEDGGHGLRHPLLGVEVRTP